MKKLLPENVDAAAEILRAGGLVAFPTETVYGLGARADKDEAVARIFAAKERPSFNPLIVHVPDLEAADQLAKIEGPLRNIAKAFWPGPVTIVAPIRAGISPLVAAGHETVALRVPNHPLALALLSRAAVPIAAPSANRSGRLSPTNAQHVLTGLDGKIDAVLDGGPTNVGLESTIIGLRDGVVRLLRPGGITAEQIEHHLGITIDTPLSTNADAPDSPGQLTSHYAPQSAVSLNVEHPQPDSLYLGFGPDFPSEFTLSADGNLIEAAAKLFGMLHDLDAKAADLGVRRIAVAPIPNIGLGVAINDRLKRAAEPR